MVNDLQFSISLEGFDQHMKNVSIAENKLKDLKAPLKIIEKYLMRRIYNGFEKSTDPYGKAWEDIAELTLLTRKKNTKDERPLIDTGKLRNSFESTIDKNTLTIGSNNEYAQDHQYGGTTASGAIIPQRMMIPTSDLGLPDLWKNKALREITNHILKY